jgi:hypothetical protein
MVVSLKAREVLILGQMPSYEERSIQMEAVLKASVTSNIYGEQGYRVRCDRSYHIPPALC